MARLFTGQELVSGQVHLIWPTVIQLTPMDMHPDEWFPNQPKCKRSVRMTFLLRVRQQTPRVFALASVYARVFE